MKYCENCGEPVSKTFIRVFGSNDGSVLACLECREHQRVVHSHLERCAEEAGDVLSISGR